jgi:hypothetical protein
LLSAASGRYRSRFCNSVFSIVCDTLSMTKVSFMNNPG